MTAPFDIGKYMDKVAAQAREDETGRLLALVEEAQIRSEVDAWIGSIRHTDRRDERLTVSELPIPCRVKVGDEWLTYEGTRGETTMVLLRDGCAAESFYEAHPSERFWWEAERRSDREIREQAEEARADDHRMGH